MSASNLRVIALSFYDGPTEGFIKGLVEDQSYFFKVIAWDDSQDQRLYLLGKVDERNYQELLEILLKSNQLSPGEVSVPSWIFSDESLLDRANDIVEAGRRALNFPVLLVLGENLIDSFKVLHSSNSQLANAVILAGADIPVSLDDWFVSCQ